MGKIKGITVILINEIETGKDDFGNPIYESVEEEVDNVLVAPASTTDITESLNLFGKKAEYTLAIPKNDSHDWTDCKVKFFGRVWSSIGFPAEGIESLLPLDWNKQVRVERYG